MVEIKEVKTRKEIKDFLNFPLNLYKGNKYFVPPLYGDEKKIFKSNYMYYDQSEAKYWNAYRDGKIVGRISAILQKASNEKWKQKRVRFTRFDSIDDQEVADALFSKVEEYAKEKGMDEVCGPLGFSDLEREGLLIEGFEYLNTFEEQYNYPYYQKLIENCGYQKDVDWLEHRIFNSPEKNDKIVKLGDMVLKRSGLHLAKKVPFKKFAKHYKEQFFELLDQTYDKLYGTVPFTKGMKNLLINNFAPIVNMNYFPVLVDDNDKIVCFALAFPSISEIMQKTNGHLYPWILPKLLHTIKHPKHVDLGLCGILPENSLSGGIAICYGEMAKMMKKDNLDYCETNLNLEDNQAIINTWSHFDLIQHKRRRSFVKNI